MDHLKRQTGFHSLSGLTAPTTKQIPRTQTQMLRDQQPQANQVAGDLVGQELPHTPL